MSMIAPDNLPEFTQTTASLKQAYDGGSLYRKKLVNGKLVSRSGFDLVGALLKHVVVWIRLQKISDNNLRLGDMFTESVVYYQKKLPPTPVLTPTMLLPPINSNHVKITSFVLKTLQLDTKYKDLKKQLEEAEKLAPLLEDSDWKELDSIDYVHELSDLNNKLKQETPQLSTEEIKLIAKCLRLKYKIVNVRELLENNPDQNVLVDMTKLRAVEDIARTLETKCEVIATNLETKCEALHDTFETQYGAVEIRDGRPLPTQAQLEGALDIAFRELPYLYDNVTDPELKRVSARLLQQILCGKNKLSEIPYPEDDCDFGIKEIADKEEPDMTPMTIPQGWSFLEFYIKTQREVNPRVIEKKLAELVNKVEWHGDERDLLKEALALYTTPKTHEEYSQMWTALSNIIHTYYFPGLDDAQKSTVDLWLRGLKESGLSEFSRQCQQASVNKYVHQYLWDYSRHGTLYRVGGLMYDIMKEGQREAFFQAFRDQYFEYLRNHPTEIQTAIVSAIGLENTVGIHSEMDDSEFAKLIQGNQPAGVAIEPILEYSAFTEEQLAELSKASGRSKDELQPLMRLKLLQFMLLCGQGIAGFQPANFNSQKENELPLERRINEMEIDHGDGMVALHNIDIHITIGDDFDKIHAVAHKKIVIGGMSDSNLPLKRNLTKAEMERLPVGTTEQEIIIHSMSQPRQAGPAGKLYYVKNVGISPLLRNNISQFVEFFTA